MRTLSAILIASLVTAGCVSAPPTTPSQKALKPAQLGLGTAPAPAVDRAWWTSFHDPQLDALIEQAFAGSPTLAAALARLRMAEAGLAESRAATYPQLDFDAEETHERFSKTYVIPPPYGGTTQWIGTIQANLSWNIDFWGRQAAMVARARASARAAARDGAAARLALAGAVAQAYVQLSTAYALCDVADRTVKDRAGILAMTETLYRNGLENASDVKEAQALLAQARQARTAADSNRELVVHAIAALVGRGADLYARIRRPSSDLAATLPLPKTLPADLLARRPDIAAAQARIAAAMSGREVARTAFYPDVNLMALAGWASVGLGPLFTADSLDYGAGPAIHLPVFDAGKLRAQYAGATAGLDAAVADYNEAVVQAVKQTADALTQSRSLGDQLRDERDALAAARDGFEMAQTRYRNGLASQLSVLQAEETLLTARRLEAALDGAAAAQRIALLVAVGGGFDAAAQGKMLSNTTSNPDSAHERR